MGQVAGVYRKSRVTKNHRVQKRRMTVKGTPEREVHQGKRTKAFCKADSENLARRTEKGVQKKTWQATATAPRTPRDKRRSSQKKPWACEGRLRLCNHGHVRKHAFLKRVLENPQTTPQVLLSSFVLCRVSSGTAIQRVEPPYTLF